MPPRHAIAMAMSASVTARSGAAASSCGFRSATACERERSAVHCATARTGVHGRRHERRAQRDVLRHARREVHLQKQRQRGGGGNAHAARFSALSSCDRVRGGGVEPDMPSGVPNAALRSAAETVEAWRLSAHERRTREAGRASSAEKKMWPGWKMQSSYVYDTPAAASSDARQRHALRKPHANSAGRLGEPHAPCANSSAAEKPSGGSSCGADAMEADGGRAQEGNFASAEKKRGAASQRTLLRAY